MSPYVRTPAAVVARAAKVVPPSVERSMAKPVCVVSPAFQVRLTCEAEAATAVRPVGAAGTAGNGVVVVASSRRAPAQSA